MIKVMVVVWGLVMFVPEGVTTTGGFPVAKELNILFANATVLEDGMEHDPRIWVVTPDGLPRELTTLVDDFKMTLAQGGEDAIDLRARWRFAQIDALNPGSGVLSECLNNTGNCDQGPHNLVLGTAVINGLWSTRHASICGDVLPLPVSYTDSASFSYRLRGDGSRRNNDPPFMLATALVLEAQVEPTAFSTLLKIGDKPVPLPQLEEGFCNQWIGPATGGPCAVVILGNPPARPMNCDDEEKSCQLDAHFKAFYYLTNDPDERKMWLPFVEENLECPRREVSLGSAGEALGLEPGRHPPLTPPAVRCPPAFAVVDE